MNAVTVRRLLVFGVCAVGVTSLYLVPGIARAPHQASAPRPQPQDEPSPSPARRVNQDASTTTRVEPTPASTLSVPSSTSAPDPEPTAQADQPTGPTAAPLDPPESRAGATAFDPADRQDDEPPAPVTGLSTAAVTPAGLTVRWPPAEDNVGVVGYKVVLNGFEVAHTSQTHARVAWFNDDARQQLVQVKAVDAAGNESPSSANLLVARPTPAPEPEPTAPTTPSPVDPTPEPEPTPAPTPGPSGTVGDGDQTDDGAPATEVVRPEDPTDEEN